MKRLQEANSTYNVYDWDTERKEMVKRVKNICYHPPSLLKKKTYRKSARSTRRGATRASINEPNKQLFDLYQQSLRQSAAVEGSDDVAEIDHEANPRNIMS